MGHRKAGSRRPFLLPAIGGAVTAVGAFLPFVSVHGGTTPVRSVSVPGIHTPDGRALLVAAGLVLVATLAGALSTRPGIRLGAAVLALMAAGVIVWATVVDVAGVKDAQVHRAALDVAAFRPGVPVERIEERLVAEGLTAGPAVGLWVSLAGGAAAVAGAAWVVVGRRR